MSKTIQNGGNTVISTQLDRNYYEATFSPAGQILILKTRIDEAAEWVEVPRAVAFNAIFRRLEGLYSAQKRLDAPLKVMSAADSEQNTAEIREALGKQLALMSEEISKYLEHAPRIGTPKIGTEKRGLILSQDYTNPELTYIFTLHLLTKNDALYKDFFAVSLIDAAEYAHALRRLARLHPTLSDNIFLFINHPDFTANETLE
jgi:hypothetical protein